MDDDDAAEIKELKRVIEKILRYVLRQAEDRDMRRHAAAGLQRYYGYSDERISRLWPTMFDEELNALQVIEMLDENLRKFEELLRLTFVAWDFSEEEHNVAEQELRTMFGYTDERIQQLRDEGQ